MGVYIWNRLPDTYQEVEYIKSPTTGTYPSTGPYINTGYIPTINTKIELQYMYDNSASGNFPIYGTWQNKSGNTRFNGWYINTDGITFGAGNQNGANGYISAPANTLATVQHYISNSTSYNVVNGTTKTTSSVSFTGASNSIYIFARNNSSSTIECGGGRIYYFRIYDNGTLVRNFIPCYRKSDSVIGLYDLVNNQFYTNAGTGTFSKGSDVNTYREKEMQNAYIGEVWTPTSNTVCYYPFDTDTLDATGNTAISGTLTKDGLGYRPTANGQINYPTGNYPLFLNYWLLIKQRPTSNTGCPFLDNPSTGYYPYHSNSSLSKKIWTFYNSSYASATVSFSPELNTWHNLSLGYDGTKMIYSIDGVSGTLYNGIGYGFSNRIGWGAASGQYIISNLIAEKTAWTSDQILNYYNTTKGDYGIS